MRLRSLLFVPGDRPDRMRKALGTGVDALILDLEDSVTPVRKDAARAAVVEMLGQDRGGVPLFVRINPLNSAHADEDLAAIAGARPDGVVLPKAEGAASLSALDQKLTMLGDAAALILPIVTETPAAMFRLGEYGAVTPRLAGLTWGAEDLPTAVGAATARDEQGHYTGPYEIARSLTLFGAAAAGVAAIETVFPDFRDLEGLELYARRGARDGFTGMLAIHPAQIAPINAAFTPTPDALAEARAIVAAFERNPDAGALAIDGRMVDAPHLERARRILAAGA